MNTAETIANIATGVAFSRSPNGCSKQVMTQLTPKERERLEVIAKRESRSLSATVRLLMLMGVEQYDNSHVQEQ